MTNIEELKARLEKLSPSEVIEYSIKNYPDLKHFHRGSKKAIIDKIVSFEERRQKHIDFGEMLKGKPIKWNDFETDI